jgi:ankyrin repeat protein
MEPISSLASILQLLDYAIGATTKAARFIHDVRHDSQAQNDMHTRIEFLRRTLFVLSSRLGSTGGGISGSGMSSISDDLNCKDEEREILRMVREIGTDCENCVKRLEEITLGQNNSSLGRRVMDQIYQEIRKPEIQRIEARIQTNVGNMQLLMSCLQLYVLTLVFISFILLVFVANPDYYRFIDDNQVARGERIEELLRDIGQQSHILKTLRGDIVDSLRPAVTNDTNDGNRTAQTQSLQIASTTNQDGDGWIQTTDRALQTADSLMDKLSRSMSDPSQASREIDSFSSTGDIPIALQYSPGDTIQFISAFQSETFTSGGVHHLQPDLMTSILDESIHQAMECLEQGKYEECEKYLQQAIQYGENRNQYHGQVFEQWFDLQIRLAEVYQMQGKPSEAQSLLSNLNQYPAENLPDYCKITPLRRAQLYHAQAKLCLHRYHRYHDITLPSLDHVARTSYTAVEELVNMNNAESCPDMHLAELARDCAEIWSKVADLSGNEVIAKVLRERHPSFNNQNDISLSGLVIQPPQQGYGTPPGWANPAIVVNQPIVSSSPSEGEILDILGKSSEASPTETSQVLAQNLCAATEEGYESLQTLLSVPYVNVEEKNSSGLTPLLIAAKRADLRSMKLLLQDLAADVDAQDNHGMNALHHSLRSFNSNNEIINLLLSRNINVNAAALPDGETPLHYCVRFKHHGAASLLLNSGRVYIEATNRRGQTAAILAVSNTGSFNVPMLKLLCSHGAIFDNAVIPREMRPVINSLKNEIGRQRRPSRQSSQTGSSRTSRRSGRWSVLSGRSDYTQ